MLENYKRPTRQRRTLARATISAILIIWLTSCTTTQKNKPAPRVTPPDPYNTDGELVIKLIPDGATVKADGDAVLLPYWYWEKIFDYIVDTQAAQDIANTKAQNK